MNIRSAAAIVAVAGTVFAVSGPSAGAVTPPEVDSAVTPPSGSAGPVEPMAQRNPCVTSGVVPGSDPAAVNPNQLSLNLSEAWTHSRGEGQIVAVIDTGVTRGPRLPNVDPGGDFVASGDGLTDCDGHGTLVAGLIAGQTGPDGFSGVAPAARILAIRQTSPRYSPSDSGEDPALTRATIDTQTLARAVVRAADMGARVITISSVTCIPVGMAVDQSELGAALRYAAVEKDVVIVAAAGDMGAGCAANPLTDPALPSDPRNWSGVGSLSIPAWWQQYVLSVGSVGADGAPSPYTMPGPWVGIAAPGERITSLSNDEAGGLANGMLTTDQQMDPVSGTGYATAYVSGVAALVRSRFPEMTAQDVVSRLTATAHAAARSPSNLVGAGGIDPVAALTWDVSLDSDVDPAAVREVAAPPAPEPKDPLPRVVAFAGVGVLALLVLAAFVVSAKRPRTQGAIQRKDSPS
ncbi:type VII secretion-associated serine protease mycosin [Mycobacterium sp. 236(2023)]|uniref:type VII secretion-associated serine protease mycosin n=1 Tax=Mycobacterium sp. 236(2023) TaxID=3038163 RepID=UPI0024156EBC|nr:type VII secretion-associated serine protease mycosin [Mycobacterium sp. 236(2023)]MDG4663182.1 type VII secretion-associated serine protease mycosin [Mycobacterium sp. 236(2023)]